jgi:hypothetical protein
VVKEDAPSGMAQIQVAEITTDLWTLASFLSKRPIKDTYGVIETPETSGLISPATTGIGESQLDVNPPPSAPPSATEAPTLGATATPDVSFLSARPG